MSEILESDLDSRSRRAVAESKDQRRERLVHLILDCQDNEQEALAELYALCSAQLFGVLLRILRQESLAEEGLQETFIKIWNNADRYHQSQGTPVTWMTSIARNQAVDILRRRSSRENHESAYPAAFANDTGDKAKSFLDMESDSEALMICLEKLEEPARDCIVRAYCEGYSHEELAEAHERPLGTVKSWIRRGLLSLRGCLDEFA